MEEDQDTVMSDLAGPPLYEWDHVKEALRQYIQQNPDRADWVKGLCREAAQQGMREDMERELPELSSPSESSTTSTWPSPAIPLGSRQRTQSSSGGATSWLARRRSRPNLPQLRHMSSQHAIPSKTEHRIKPSTSSMFDDITNLPSSYGAFGQDKVTTVDGTKLAQALARPWAVRSMDEVMHSPRCDAGSRIETLPPSAVQTRKRRPAEYDDLPEETSPTAARERRRRGD